MQKNTRSGTMFMLRYIFYAQVQFPPDFLVMILNAKNSNIILWANLPDYAKKNRLRYKLRYSFMLFVPERYRSGKNDIIMLNDILLLAMISNAKNRHINLWANLPYHAKKTRSGTRSGTELG